MFVDAVVLQDVAVNISQEWALLDPNQSHLYWDVIFENSRNLAPKPCKTQLITNELVTQHHIHGQKIPKNRK